ncbi:MAG TPA: acetyl-CoA hydrolase/transferase C-terminal domain-containing protein, partial [Paracoccaceae bacterium]|nr:acetyl-CoA hydrolase/transferase C-terminal domain-containing protein [Paracoccaceae bacterium]
ERLGDMTFTGIFVPGLNRPGELMTAGFRVQTFFMMPEFAGQPDRVTFLPLCYRDILALLRASRIDAALLSLSPPDAAGLCSFGSVTDFMAELWPQIPVRIAHINPRLPRTRGCPGIPFAEVTAVLEGEEELPGSAPGRDEVSERIGRHAAGLVPDGATLQCGLGRVPETALSMLGSHRGLKIHSGLIGDSALDLLEAGALAAGTPVTAGVAIGTRRLYDAIGGEAFRFRPVSYTHSLRVLSGIERLVTINSAIEVDLVGQAYAEHTSRGYFSGPGGASDFAAGARAPGSCRIVVLPSTGGHGKASRIIGPGEAAGPVSLGRFDIDFVVTEHGIADLRWKTHDQRAEALIALADPAHRARLQEAWDASRRT